MAFKADSRAATATRVMAVPAHSMPAMLSTAAKGELRSGEFQGSTAAMMKIEPM